MFSFLKKSLQFEPLGIAFAENSDLENPTNTHQHPITQPKTHFYNLFYFTFIFTLCKSEF